MTADRQPQRPGWLSHELYPFESHYAEIDGASVHYVDEGSGPPLLLLHGNPTWSFLYRELIKGLRDRYRCIAPDHPGFGLSRAAPGYGYTPREHAAVLEQLVAQLDLSDITMMVQDWGGPIGFAAATRHPERFAAFVIGNTWAWPKSDPGTQIFSRLLGGPIGGYLILRRKLLRREGNPRQHEASKAPSGGDGRLPGVISDAESRRPVHVFPREILRSRPFLADIEQGLGSGERPAGSPCLADQRHRVQRARTTTVGADLP